MKREVLAFAQAKVAFGFSETVIRVENTVTLEEIMELVGPGVSLEGLRVAVDCEFVDWQDEIGEGREIAIIPPVSGG